LFKILVNYPTLSQEKTVLDTYQTEKDVHTKKLLNVAEFQKLRLEVESVKIDDTIKHYIANIVNQTREKNPNILY
jgi:MoxR-like ATPase